MVSVLCDGKELRITQNAYDFLCYALREGLFQDTEGSDNACHSIFRLSREQTTALNGVTPKHLWIDAICIAQTDLEERSHQVAIMGDIYQRSLMTIVWLGNQTPHPGAQLIIQNFVPRFNNLYRAQGSSYLRGMDPSCTAPELVLQLGKDACEEWRRYYPHFFQLLAERRWFNRGWVVQEVVLKSIQNEHDVVVVSGSFVTPWSELLTFLAALTTTDWRRTISNRLRSHPLAKHFGDTISHVLQRQRALDRIQRSMEDKDAHRNEHVPMTDLEWSHTLLFLTVRRMRGREFTDRRDTIYGCYGLLSHLNLPGASTAMPAPDYHLSAREVWTLAAWDMIRNMPYLLLLNAVEPRPRSPLRGLPSWVPDFSGLAPGAPIMHILSALGREDMPMYDASGQRSPRAAFRLTDQNGLVLRGVRLSTISTLGPTFYPRQHVSRLELEWFLKILVSHKGRQTGGGSVEEALCRTLIANIFPVSVTPEAYPKAWRSWWAKGLLHRLRYLEEENVGSGAIIPDLMQELGNGGEWFPLFSEVSEANLEDETSKPSDFASVMHRLWIMRGFFVTDDESFGIGPRTLCVSDEVWLLEGGRTPFILRGLVGGQYSMVGEAYVHGVMYGEAMTPDVVGRVGAVTIL